MSAPMSLTLVAAILAGLLAGMAGLKRVAAVYDWPAEVQRKLVHVAAGTTAMTLPWLFSEDWPVWTLLSLTLGVMILMRMPALSGLGSTVHGVKRRSWGDLMLVAAVALVFLFSARDPVLYLLPLGILTLADAAAAIAGSSFGKRRYTVAGGQKSVEGSAVFFAVTLAVTIVSLRLLADLDVASVLLVSVLIAAFATLVEADSWAGFDNLFLPLGTLILLRSAELVDISGLVLRVSLLFAVILAAAMIQRRGYAGGHLVRVHILALFLILNVTALWNAVLPALMLAAQWLTIRRDGDGGRAALDTIGALALISFGSEALGAATGLNALAFYGLAAGSAVLGHVGLALAAVAPAYRLIGGFGAFAAVLAIWHGAVAMNPPASRWFEAGSGVFAVVFLVALVVPLVRPEVIRPAASLRIGLMAALPAAGLFLHQWIGATQ